MSKFQQVFQAHLLKSCDILVSDCDIRSFVRYESFVNRWECLYFEIQYVNHKLAARNIFRGCGISMRSTDLDYKDHGWMFIFIALHNCDEELGLEEFDDFKESALQFKLCEKIP